MLIYLQLKTLHFLLGVVIRCRFFVIEFQMQVCGIVACAGFALNLLRGGGFAIFISTKKRCVYCRRWLKEKIWESEPELGNC